MIYFSWTSSSSGRKEKKNQHTVGPFWNKMQLLFLLFFFVKENLGVRELGERLSKMEKERRNKDVDPLRIVSSLSLLLTAAREEEIRELALFRFVW